MHILALLPLLSLTTFTTALPAPSPSTTPPSTTTNTTCSAAVMALASGIQSNIADQNNELATVSALGNVLAQSPIDMTLYSATQASLLNFVNKGIAIRENNQKIAPPGNGAIAGLATVAMAQMTELNLTMSLVIAANGTDVAKANQTVESLKGDFKGGIVQNMKNLAAATAGCTPPAATGKPAARSVAY